jgi:Fungal N-terminal domain of STAND proteins
MDPFSITVGALGITEFAVSSIVQLHDFINDISQAEEVLQDVALNLEGIQRPLNTLESLSIADGWNSDAAKEDLKKTGVVEAVNNCGQACDKLSKNLKKWTKHSGSAKYSLRDRLSVGVWNKEKIRTFKTQVQSCQAIVQLAVTSTLL